MKPLIAALLLGLAAAAHGEAPPGANVESLLAIVREGSPDLRMVRLEAEAARERIGPAGALPDPFLRVELENITRNGAQNATLSPSRAGDAKYLLAQPLPFWGKRDLKREIAAAEAEQAGVLPAPVAITRSARRRWSFSNASATRRMAHELRRSVAGEAPFLIAEVYTGAGTWGVDVIRYYLGPDGPDSVFDFPLMWAIRDVLAHESAGFAAIEDMLVEIEGATAGSGATQLSFGVATSGTVNYTWTTVPTGTSGSGTFSGSTATITGLPANAIIDLSITPANFQRINIDYGSDKSRLTDVRQWGDVAGFRWEYK